MTLFNNVNIQARARKGIRETTLRDFSGGLNVADNDLSLNLTFQKVLDNFYRAQDGSITLRYGTRLFCNLTSIVTGRIIHMDYLGIYLYAFTSTGQVAKMDSSGVGTLIWSSAIAGALPGAPTGWGATFKIVTTTQFKGEMIASNGVDKPILISTGGVVTYLQDLATGSNSNTPISKYVTTVADYLVFAGDTANKGLIHISAKGTSGTFYGDPMPNDATTYDVGAKLPSEGYEITAISSYNNQLIIHFIEGTVSVTLGTYDDTGVHQPAVGDIIPQLGAIGQHTIQNTGDDSLFADLAGVGSVSRNITYLGLVSERLSDLIAPDIQGKIASLSQDASRYNVHAIFNKLTNQYMLFVPNTNDWSTTTETLCYVYTVNKKLKVAAWSRFLGWNFSASARSSLGRVFLAKDRIVYVYGDRAQADEIFSDYMPDAVTDGTPIMFNMESPWFDMGDRAKNKLISFIMVDTLGTAQFDLSIYTDRIRLTGEDQHDAGMLLAFVAGESEGYGNYDQPYGGGRRTADERLWGFPIKAKQFKFRLSGSTTKKLQLVAVTFLYNVVSMIR